MTSTQLRTNFYILQLKILPQQQEQQLKLTYGDFIVFPQHDVVWSKISVDNVLLLVNVP